MNGEGLAGLTYELSGAVAQAEAGAAKVFAVGANKIKKSWRASASGLAHAPAYPYSISYDMTGATSAEIGPDKGMRQGALGNLIEYGSVNNPPHNNGERALDEELPHVEEHLAALGTAWVHGGGVKGFMDGVAARDGAD